MTDMIGESQLEWEKIISALVEGLAELRAEVEKLRDDKRYDGIKWYCINDEPFEYAIQQGPIGTEFVKLINGKCLRRSHLASDDRS